VKGQRLFVRETTAGDEGALGELYARDGVDPGSAIGREGCLARLVGDLVGHMTWELDRNRAVITHVYVARALRGKRIGRAMLAEAAAIAKAKNVARLVVSGACPLREFFLRTGFAEVGSELMRKVS
jgi:GNAT superfamily N-acetyltransferase